MATIVLLALLAGLGIWQLDRAEQKRELIRSRDRGAATDAVDLNSRRPGFKAVRHRQAVARGRYDTDHQFLLDNQMLDGRPGYHVVTPLRLEGQSGAVLVDRGWVAAPAQRDDLPDVGVPATLRTVRGQIDDGPSVGIRLGEAATESRWPRRLLYMDFRYMEEALPYPLRGDYLVELSPEAPDGYARAWQNVEFGPERHVGYAVQWFALAGALLMIYLIVNTKRSD